MDLSPCRFILQAGKKKTLACAAYPPYLLGNIQTATKRGVGSPGKGDVEALPCGPKAQDENVPERGQNEAHPGSSYFVSDPARPGV